MNHSPSGPEISMIKNVATVVIKDSPITMINHVGMTNNIRETAREHMPSKPAIFHGREDLVEEISQLICDEMSSRRVCILGPGGMGKTSVALTVVETPAVKSRYGSRCFWVPCVAASSSFELLQVLYTQLCSARTTPMDNMLSTILAELTQVEEPTLLLLDNFETPWFPSQGTTQAVDDILFQLNTCSHVAILLTMRLLGDQAPCHRINWHTRRLQPVSSEASRFIFHDVYPGLEKDPDLDALLAAVGHMPYAVLLLAKSGQISKFKAAKLLKEWNRTGTIMISFDGSPEQNMNRSIDLSVGHHFVQKNPDALLLLQTLALLPAGTSIDHLEHWAPNIISLSLAIYTLSNAALLLRSENDPTTLSILPVVQSFMHANKRIPQEVFQNVHRGCYHFITDHIDRCEGLQPQDHRLLVVTESRNIHFILNNSNPKNVPTSVDKHAKCLLYFALDNSRHEWDPDFTEHALNLSRKLIGDQEVVAQALFGLASNHAIKGAWDTAEKYFSESYRLFGQFTDHGATLQSALFLVRCRQQLNKPIIEFLQTLQVTFSDDFQKASIKRLLGEAFQKNGEFREALKTLQEAKDLFMRTDRSGEAAEILKDISYMYFNSSEFEKSLASILEAQEAARSSGLPSLTIAWINLQHGRCLVSLRRDTEALPIFQECWPTCESEGFLLGVSQCFKYIGLIRARQGNPHDACVAFEEAIVRYTELGDTAVGGRQEIMELERLIKVVKGANAEIRLEEGHLST